MSIFIHYNDFLVTSIVNSQIKNFPLNIIDRFGQCMLLVTLLFLSLKQRLWRRRTLDNRSEDTHEYMTLRRRYPQPGSSNHRHPHHSQPTPSGVLSIGDHGTTEVINYPRHYVTRIPSRESDDSDYEAPVSVDQTPVYQEIEYNEDIYDDVEETQT